VKRNAQFIHEHGNFLALNITLDLCCHIKLELKLCKMIALDIYPISTFILFLKKEIRVTPSDNL